MEKECDEGGWQEEGRQFGEWLRVNPSRKREGRGKWTEGGSLGGSTFQKKDMSGGRSLGQKGSGSAEASRKFAEVGEDNLDDDGTSPLKLKPCDIREGTPKKLDFGADLVQGVEQSGSGLSKPVENTKEVLGVSQVVESGVLVLGVGPVERQKEGGIMIMLTFLQGRCPKLFLAWRLMGMHMCRRVWGRLVTRRGREL